MLKRSISYPNVSYRGLLETGMHDPGKLNVDPRQTRPVDSSVDSSAGGVDDFEQKGPQSTFLYIAFCLHWMWLGCGYLGPLDCFFICDDHGDDDDDDGSMLNTQRHANTCDS